MGYWLHKELQAQAEHPNDKCHVLQTSVGFREPVLEPGLDCEKPGYSSRKIQRKCSFHVEKNLSSHINIASEEGWSVSQNQGNSFQKH